MLSVTLKTAGSRMITASDTDDDFDGIELAVPPSPSRTHSTIAETSTARAGRNRPGAGNKLPGENRLAFRARRWSFVCVVTVNNAVDA